MGTSLTVRVESWPIAGRFTISRGAKTEAVVVVAELAAGGVIGRGECVPYRRYGETVDDAVAAIEERRGDLANGLDRLALQALMKAGAARNALDCAFWDLEAKRSNTPVHALAGVPPARPVTTAFTLSLGTPDEMAAAAETAAHRPLLKIKLGAAGDPARLAAVRRAAPKAELIVDANEGWHDSDLEENFAACAAAGVTLIEQPLRAEDDSLLEDVKRPVRVCADESIHDRSSLAGLRRRYDAVNIKLDKSGGLTEGLALAAEAERFGLGVMVGCMVATSLSMAPALLVAQRAQFVDLDGPLLLAQDRPDGLTYEGSVVHPATPALWG
jgi:L-alanine-DL-glutamate epimerase-like enolase superfamily enzyme